MKITVFIFLTIVLSFGLVAQSQEMSFANAKEISIEKYGRPLPILQRPNGSLQFTVPYEYQTEVSWVFIFASRVSYTEVSELGEQIYWTIMDKKKLSDSDQGKLFKWRAIAPHTLVNGELILRRRTILSKLLPRQDEMILVFSQGENKEPLYHVDFTYLCENYEYHFNDNDKERVSCRARLPRDWNKMCPILSDHYCQNIMDGVNSRGEASSYYRRRGCGDVLRCAPPPKESIF